MILPSLIVVLLYMCAIIVRICQLRQYLVNDLLAPGADVWDKARAAVALLWECHGWIWHSYEVCGLDNIPDKGPAVIVYYHGAIPVDYYYLNSRYFIYKKRLMWTIAANFLFKIPGWSLMLEVFRAFPGEVQQCAQLLRDGQIIAVSPGGIREAQFSNEYYQLVWNGRVGFAKVACLGKAPIIPVFTQNIREAFRTSPFFRETFRAIYEKTRLPLLPIFGGFPVKLRTHVGKPIEYDPNATPEEVAEKTAKALEELIRRHQKLPGSIVNALVERCGLCIQ